MERKHQHHSNRRWLLPISIIAFFLVLGAAYGGTSSASAAQGLKPSPQSGDYGGPEQCGACHQELYDEWQSTRHAHAFSSPIFQQNWEELGSEFNCLECHTTGFQAGLGEYAYEGVTCESCHGAFVKGHPEERMPINPDHELCASCHEFTTDEWEHSGHGQAGIQCQACHDPHKQEPLAPSVTELCSNCHKDPGSSFTHGTHSDAGLECSNCHMYTSPRTTHPIEGLTPTGHTFTIGSEACIGCHQDTVHSRDSIVRLQGEVTELGEIDPDKLRKEVQEQEATIKELETQRSVRLYTGLAQGAIVGLAVGATVAWVLSRSLRVVEEEGDEDEQASEEA